MAAVTLILGAIVFQGFEVPDRIPFGGEQALAVHKMPGGDRIIDAMGPDDRDITWSGRFRGVQAESRSRTLDGYRKTGKPLGLSWGSHRYHVVIRAFEPDYEQPFEIPYSITCVVLPPSPPKPAGPFDITKVLGPDLTKIATLGGAINVSTINSAVSGVQSAISTAQSVYSTVQSGISTAQAAIGAVNTLKGSFKGGIGGIGDAIEQAQGAVLDVTTQAEGTLASAGLFTPGSSPSALVSSLTATANGFSQLDNLYQMGDTLKRMSKNLIGQ